MLRIEVEMDLDINDDASGNASGDGTAFGRSVINTIIFGKDHAYLNPKDMKQASYFTLIPKLAASAFVAISALCGCVHTPPGTPVAVALARRPVLVRMPLAPQTTASHTMGAAPVARGPVVEPALPKAENVDRVADAYSRGNFCMQAGNDAEAIKAFEEAVKVDPKFTEAWQNLAVLYEKVGDEKKAVEAFRRSKKIASQ